MPVRYVHTNIISRNWRALADFYIKVFECIPVPPERSLRGEWLSQGTGVRNAAFEGVHLRLPGYGDEGPTLEIYQYQMKKEKPAPAANRLGYGHLAFLVDDVDAMLQKVLHHGGSPLGKISQYRIEGVGYLTFVYALDPEGNILELQHWS